MENRDVNLHGIYHISNRAGTMCQYVGRYEREDETDMILLKPINKDTIFITYNNYDESTNSNCKSGCFSVPLTVFISVFTKIKDKNPIKYLLITLTVLQGSAEHTHRVLTTTKAANIKFAAQRYVAKYWGEGKRESKNSTWWEFTDSPEYMWIKLDYVKQLSEMSYLSLEKLFSTP